MDSVINEANKVDRLIYRAEKVLDELNNDLNDINQNPPVGYHPYYFPKEELHEKLVRT
jgi:hypothetical protein